ncbi:transglutaminase domain-containing protein [Echinicola soli]|uniref:Transglutaminase domain-containing protein n=1 Tax=Echinicola soli TaxID=2591634 RepID=A0A514CE07_9BACT|nr:transglutaminase-like domain-containing protein [Echinicola soli]QDH78000.1 transglutaminase domain-containing protein [Echinicola soli]
MRRWVTVLLVGIGLTIPVFLHLLSVNLWFKPKKEENLSWALEQAGHNRLELERALMHYALPKDSLKLRALNFLLDNMHGKYTLDSPDSALRDTFFSEIGAFRESEGFKSNTNHSDNLSNVECEYDKVISQAVSGKTGLVSRKPDLKHITSEYLIDNLEYAFKAYCLPWHRKQSFSEFCEYILPYRIGNGRSTAWRKRLWEAYTPLIDSLKSIGITDPIEVAKIINLEAGRDWIYSVKLDDWPIDPTIKNLLDGRIGNCRQQTQFGVAVLRALGVPAVHEQVPFYGNRSLGHDFIGVIGKDGSVTSMDLGHEAVGRVLDIKEEIGYYIPKVYRYVYADTGTVLGKKERDINSVYPYFRQLIRDVTKEYLPVSDVKLVLYDVPEREYYAYLCVFDNRRWRPVAISLIEDGKVVFKDMGVNIVYLPMYFSRGQFFAAYDPFILNSDGKVKKVIHENKGKEMILHRKYFKTNIFKRLSGINGKFQVANKADFSDAKDIHVINDPVNLVTHRIPLRIEEEYQYVRYLFFGGINGQMAEMGLYDECGQRLSGKIITNNLLEGEESVKNVFDGDVLTPFELSIWGKKQWYGLDMRSKKKLSELSFCPRTDKNDVWSGLKYELFYWDKRWVSLGVQEAKSNQLTYTSPVSGGIYLLRCLDEGKEERIFTYENGKQVWW